jgi:hypothetical protein
MNNENPEAPVKNLQEESIFDKSDFELRGYDKHIRNSRILFFVLSGLVLINLALIDYSGDGLEMWISVGLTLCLSAVYLVLGFYTLEKPYTAIMIGLTLYILLIALSAIIEPMSVLRGIILKIIVIVLLVRGLGNARDAQRWKDALKGR